MSARECAEWLVGERGTHAVDDASALIDAYAERVAEERMAEAVERYRREAVFARLDADTARERAREVAESMDRMGLASLEGPAWVQTPRSTWDRWRAILAAPLTADAQEADRGG